MRVGLVGGLLGLLIGGLGAELWAHQNKRPPPYIATVDSTPQGAFLYIDGRLLTGQDGAPIETPARLHNLPSDRVTTIEIRKPAFVSETRQLSLRNNDTSAILQPETP